MRKLIFLLAIGLLISTSLSAQHQVFSQFTSTPLIVNPGYTGDVNGRFRVYTHSQSEASGHSGDIYRFNISGDAKFSLGQKSELGVGINGWLKQYKSFSGYMESYMLSTAIHHYFGDKSKSHHKISLGLSYRQVFLSKHWSTDKFNYGLFSTGLLWRYQSVGRFSIEAGLSVYGLNTPVIPFKTNNSLPIELNSTPQPQLLTCMSLAEFPIGKQTSLLPTVYYLTRVSAFQKLSYGSFFRYYPKADSSRRFYQFGFFGKRNVYSDSSQINASYLSSVMNAQFNRVSVGLSYDVLASTLMEFGTANLIEFSLGLRI